MNAIIRNRVGRHSLRNRLTSKPRYRKDTVQCIVECAQGAEKALGIVAFLSEFPSQLDNETFVRAAQLEAEAASIRAFSFSRGLIAQRNAQVQA